MKKNWKSKIPIVIAVSLLGTIGISFLVMSLWNAILVPALHVGTLNMWQSAGLFLLSKILFGRPWHRHFGQCHNMRKKAWMLHFQNMTQEERNKFNVKYASCNYKDSIINRYE